MSSSFISCCPGIFIHSLIAQVANIQDAEAVTVSFILTQLENKIQNLRINFQDEVKCQRLFFKIDYQISQCNICQ